MTSGQESAQSRWKSGSSSIELITEILAAEDVDINELVEGTTYLMDAVDRKLLEVVTMLLANPGLDLSVVDKLNRNAVYHAVQTGNLPCIELLISDARCTPKIISCREVDDFSQNYQRCVLAVAMEDHKSPDILKTLLDFPGIRISGYYDINTRDYQRMDKKLLDFIIDKENFSSCKTKSSDLMKWLFDLDNKDISVNMCFDYNRTLLSIAMDANHLDIVEFLLSLKNTQLDIFDKDGKTALVTACLNNHVECVKLFISDKRCTPHIVNRKCSLHGWSDQYWFPAFSSAVIRGHMDIVKMLLEYPEIDVNIEDARGNIPLYHAIYNKHRDVLELLLNHPTTDVNKVANDSTPLKCAIEFASKDLVQLILTHPDLDVNKETKRNTQEGYSTAITPLGFAIEKDFKEALQLLLDHPSIDVNKKDGLEELSPLHRAMAKNQEDVVRLLLAHNSLKLENVNRDGATALMDVCGDDGDNYQNIIDLFISDTRCTASIINMKDEKEGLSALLQAILHRNLVIVRMLLECPGINCNITDSNGATPLMLAMGKDGSPRLVKLLLAECNAELDLSDNEGKNALIYGILAENLESVRILASDDRCTPQVLNKKYEHPLTLRAPIDIAKYNESREIFELLVRIPTVDCNYQYSMAMRNNDHEVLALLLTNPTIRFDHDTDLIRAAFDNNLECVRLVVKDARCTPEILNMQNEVGETALMTAVAYCNTEIVEILAELPGIDFEAKNKKGKTVMDLAMRQYDQTSLRILKSKMEKNNIE